MGTTMQQQTSPSSSSLVRRTGLASAGLALLVLVAVGSNAPWFGTTTTAPLPALSGQALHVIIDEQRVIQLTGEGKFHTYEGAVLVTASSLERSGPSFFTVSPRGAIASSAVPTQDTWSAAFDPSRGVVIESPDGTVGWVATTKGAAFQLEQPTGETNPLRWDEPVATMGVDIGSVEIVEPPTFNPLHWAVAAVAGFALFLFIYGVPIMVGTMLLALLVWIIRYALIPRYRSRSKAVALPFSEPNLSADLEDATDADLVAQAAAVTDVDIFIERLRNLPDRRQAVQLAYTFLAIGQPGIPPRTTDSTPLEWLAALSAYNPTTANLAAELVDRYLPVRFADSTPTEMERTAAIDSLQATVAHATEEPAR